MKTSKMIWGIFAIVSVILAGSAFHPASARNAGPAPYIIICRTSAIPVDIDKQVFRAGGAVTAKLHQIGVVIATSDDPEFTKKASKIRGVMTAAEDEWVQWINPRICEDEGSVRSLSIGDDETYWPYQWAPRAIYAPDAWDAGARGSGVRVAILDGGIASNHLDLDANIDFGASASFVPGFNFNEEAPGAFWHGSHVAGIVAAEDNGRGTIGIAPEATIIGVKVLHDGGGYFSWTIQGILYAADVAGADLINLSLGALYARNSRGAAQLNSALGRAMNYAYQAGITIVASAGNDYLDLDHAGYWVKMPAEAQHVICVSATGPVGFAYGGADFDRPASYTNFGKSLVDLAAPGGDFVLYPNGYWYCDMVMAPTYVSGINHYYSWAAGTSQAAPHVAGVAALIIEAHGGSLHPAQVKAILQQSADDLGKPGNDEYYGMGRINAFKAVTIR